MSHGEEDADADVLLLGCMGVEAEGNGALRLILLRRPDDELPDELATPQAPVMARFIGERRGFEGQEEEDDDERQRPTVNDVSGRGRGCRSRTFGLWVRAEGGPTLCCAATCTK